MKNTRTKKRNKAGQNTANHTANLDEQSSTDTPQTTLVKLSQQQFISSFIQCIHMSHSVPYRTLSNTDFFIFSSVVESRPV